MTVKGEDAVQMVRRELLAIIKRGNKITERDLLRLSALTGIDYSTILKIQEEIS